MWISDAWAYCSPKRGSFKLQRRFEESSDDETCSDASSSDEELLVCPVCWDSFNVVENVPYVLWCGHTLCKICVLSLHWAQIKLFVQKIKFPLFISCPWCHCSTLRLAYKGKLKFPSKNFYVLWMVETRNGKRGYTPSVCSRDSQFIWSSRLAQVIGNSCCNPSPQRTRIGTVESNVRAPSSRLPLARLNLSLNKSIDFFIRLINKIPLIFVLVLFVVLVVPICALVLLLYLLITLLFAIPSFLVLYFAYPALDWLTREIIA